MKRFALPEVKRHPLEEGLMLTEGRLPAGETWDEADWEQLWSLHPEEQPQLEFGGERRRAPRWHQAFGRDYAFSASYSRALPWPARLERLRDWVRGAVDERLNGALVNWYDGAHQHRIAAHRDTPEGLIPDCPIVTVSLGAPRTFELIRKRVRLALRVEDGTVIVLPAEVNRRYAHRVLHRDTDAGRRISVTFRGFE